MAGNEAGELAPRVKVQVKGAKDLSSKLRFGKVDSFCTCEIVGKPRSWQLKTPVVQDSSSPKWNHLEQVKDYAKGDPLQFSVWLREEEGHSLIGRALLEADKFLPDGFHGDLELSAACKRGKKGTLQVEIEVSLPRLGCEEYELTEQTPSGITSISPPERVFILSVAPDSWASKHGIAVGAEIVAVNGTTVQEFKKKHWKKELQKRPLRLEICAREDAWQAATKEPGLQQKQQPPPRVTLRIKIINATDLRSADWGGKSDPYCTCQITGKPDTSFETEVIKKTLNPSWNHDHVLEDVSIIDSLDFCVFDWDKYNKSDSLGHVTLEPHQFLPRGFNGSVRLDDAGKKHHAALSLIIEVLTPLSSTVHPAAATEAVLQHLSAPLPSVEAKKAEATDQDDTWTLGTSAKEYWDDEEAWQENVVRPWAADYLKSQGEARQKASASLAPEKHVEESVKPLRVNILRDRVKAAERQVIEEKKRTFRAMFEAQTWASRVHRLHADRAARIIQHNFKLRVHAKQHFSTLESTLEWDKDSLRTKMRKQSEEMEQLAKQSERLKEQLAEQAEEMNQKLAEERSHASRLTCELAEAQAMAAFLWQEREERWGFESSNARDRSRSFRRRQSCVPQATVTSVLAEMSAHKDEVAVVERACAALGSLAHASAEQKQSFCDDGGIEAVVEAMVKYPDVTLVQEAACAALAMTSTAGEESRARFASVDGIVAVMACMETHKGDPFVLQEACEVCAQWGEEGTGDFSRKIVAAMRMYESDSMLQERACAALANISALPSNAEVIISAGGVKVLANAMLAHKHKPNLQLSACVALVNLARIGAVHQAMIFRAGCLELVVDAIREFPGDAALQEEACATLAHLTSVVEEARNRVISLGGSVWMIDVEGSVGLGWSSLSESRD